MISIISAVVSVTLPTTGPTTSLGAPGGGCESACFGFRARHIRLVVLLYVYLLDL